MKNILLPLLAGLTALLASCASTPPPPPQVFRTSEVPAALVIDSIDGANSRLLLPDITKDAPDDATLAQAKALGKQPVAVVILENYREAQPGDEFRDRGVPWFVNLRNLGYERIIFLQGNGTANPDGLATVVKYY